MIAALRWGPWAVPGRRSVRRVALRNPIVKLASHTAPDSKPVKTAVHVAQAMFAAHIHGRLDEMFSYIHPDIRWMPLTRPGRTLYVGHEETMQFVIDVRSSLGEHRIEWEEFAELGEGRVLCIGRPVMISDAGETPGPGFECILTFRDGRVIQLESQPRRPTTNRTQALPHA